jgi:membrane protein implicated in regulation of membrane protease activity
MTRFRRYLLFQLPGWALAVFAAVWLARTGMVSVWMAATLATVWIGKDFVLYPLVRRSYEPRGPDGAAALIGEDATVSDALAPQGYVRVRGELWRARLLHAERALPRGASVRIADVDGATLLVTSRPHAA